MKPERTLAFDCALEPRVAPRGAIGLLALTTDATVEAEWRALLDFPSVEFYVTRVPCDTHINAANLADTETHLCSAAANLLPGTKLDVLAYACTSATVVIGESAVHGALRGARPGVEVTTPMTAAKAAFRALGVRRIALLTPYVEEINRMLRTAFEASGIRVSAAGSFFEDSDSRVVRIAADSILAAAETLAARTDADALFIACTALRAGHLVPELEESLELPVTTSNHAMAWHALRLAQVRDCTSGKGRLFSQPGV